MLVESPPRQADDGEQWMPVSDLMAVLMLIFIFIAVIFIRDVWSGEESARIECDKIYNALNDRFADDFEKWDVEFLKKDLTIRFRNPEILFESDKDKIRPRFERVLGDFFPSYIETVRPYKTDIVEFRIDGHTSSEYKGAIDPTDAYIKNMRLSQDRSGAVLRYVLGLPGIETDSDWVRPNITANGWSSSRLIYDGEIEDKQLSRRVEFRLLAASCQKAGETENVNQN